MKFWLDTEFIENGKTIDLMSIGIVAEDGREFYAENLDCDLSMANDWVEANVIAHLQFMPTGQGRTIDGLGGLVHHASLGSQVLEFVQPEKYGKPEFWGYYADYDWVVFCQLFGRMIDLPKGFPMYCNDLKQVAVALGDPELPKQVSTEHHALADAHWNKVAWHFLHQGKD